MPEKVSFLKKAAYNFTNFIKSKDSFGVPVGLTIKGESEFKTLYGGILSLCLKIYFVYLLV